MMCKEIWKDVKGYEGIYRVSEYGEVWSIKNKIYLRTTTGTTDYKRVTLSKNGGYKHCNVHRLVAKHFVDNPNSKECVNHLDENKLNNHYSNLQWTTHEENNNYGNRNQKIINSRKSSQKWADFQRRRVEKLSKPIIGVNCINGEIVEFQSANQAGRNGFHQGSIWQCLNGKQKTHKKYKWYLKFEYERDRMTCFG